MPRKATKDRNQGRTPKDNESPRKAKSIKDLARPYLLTVAKLQLKALETTWSIGSNRKLDTEHVSKLKSVFEKEGLKRMAPENRLICVCKAGDVQASTTKAIYQPFEVLDGQHRIAALRDYVGDTENDHAELWWTCELYDQETLPKNLAQIMRFNCIDPTISAGLSHAQIWMQLVNIASPTGEYKAGHSDVKNSDQDQLIKLDYSIIDAIRVDLKADFPSRRLAILWNKRPWRRVITEWCSTCLGMEMFAISSMEWNASLRIDEYFFEMMEAALNTLRSLPLDMAIHISPDDWDQLAVGYETTVDQAPDTLSIFYEAAGTERVRRSGFLTSLSDAEYDAFYQHMITDNHYDFPRPHRISRLHIEAMVQVLHHVIAWIDPEMANTLLQQSRGAQSRPLIRTCLRDALGNFARSNGISNFKASDEQAIAMQKFILDFAREQVTQFLDCPNRPTFFTGGSAPDFTTTDYTMRFGYIVWTQLLRFTRELLANVTGSPTLTFRQEWDRIADTLPTPTELRGYLCRTIANARDPAAIEMVTSVLQEALATISKPLSSQGASENAKSDPATRSTGTSLEVDPESLPTIDTLLRRDDKLPVTRQGSTDLSESAARCKIITSTPHEHSGTGADETEMHLDDCVDFGESLSISPARIGSKREVDMPPAGTKVTTARSTPKSLPQMQSTISHDSATSGQPNLILPPVGQKTQESRTRTRTSFTPAEDAALLIYVESHTKDCTGYQIYKVFAESVSFAWASWGSILCRVLCHILRCFTDLR
ncbi:hypothetical protein E4U47_007416 [Claviceps purpurea]|nr:hypothetical protein E4U11_007720 [Claviceps purpurea]KAG6263331.1 hypothetical protein E4U47_007416 [Claviceps purpurea]